ncbi:MAG: hypothetical protein P4N24_17315, partial [Acidobacteriota bacterium]|nr:hypothetical protein [Acidobacteriota bacterium]
ISRLDYDFTCEGGFFPAHIEMNSDPAVARWIERVVHLLPIAPRPDHYCPLDEKNLDKEWIRRLGQSGKDCYAAILAKDTRALGASMNECMGCWEAILPCTVRHPAISIDLIGILNHYQSRYAGAMYSGCGGGYLYVVSEEPVPGSLHVQVRRAVNSE